MLARLAIRDIVLIDRLDLDLAEGLTVLTGETGAGKSILLDAFALALGARGDGALVRAGQAQGSVTAVFDLGPDHAARLAARELDVDDDGDLVLRRVQLADGRTRAFVNDRPVSAQGLRAIGKRLVEIHGQHDERALVDASAHRALLDLHGGLDARAAAVAAAHARWRAAAKALKQEEEALARARGEQEFLRHAVDELTKLAPQAGEEQALAERRQGMQAAEKVAGDLKEAYEMVAGRGSPVAQLSDAVRRLERRAARAPELAGPAVAALDAALVALDDARSALETALMGADFDPRELEATEERLFALRGAARKYAVPADDLAAKAEQLSEELALIDAGEKRSAELAKEAAAQERAFRDLAATLSTARHAAAVALSEAVNAELPPLRLERARFEAAVDSDPGVPGPEGYDRVEFRVQTNPGTKPGPMMKVASGGELSRFVLALKVVLAAKASAPTLVFDEVDTGVGGAVADAIGQRLARLAERVQVITVTHAPQVAARAARHLLIAKDAVEEGARVATRVAPLDKRARREEVARMLAGESVTDAARKAADQLIRAAS